MSVILLGKYCKTNVRLFLSDSRTLRWIELIDPLIFTQKIIQMSGNLICLKLWKLTYTNYLKITSCRIDELSNVGPDSVQSVITDAIMFFAIGTATNLLIFAVTD